MNAPPEFTPVHRPSPTSTSRTTKLAALALVLGLVLTSCWSGNQNKALDHVNATRRANGKAAVSGDRAAMRKAQAWSQHMANTGKLSHSGRNGGIDTSGLPCWRAVAENVGYGSTVASVHAALVRSPGHFANMTGNYKRAGTGVVRKGDTVWITQIFYLPC